MSQSNCKQITWNQVLQFLTDKQKSINELPKDTVAKDIDFPVN